MFKDRFEAIELLKKIADDIVCLEVLEPFIGVGASYTEFEQVTDNEIITLFKQDKSKKLI